MITATQLGRNGEFGNQLFQIAAVIGTALKHNVLFNFPKWKCVYSQIEYSKCFINPISETLDVQECFDVFKEPSYSYTEIPYSPNQKLDLQGYFQSEKYFSHCEAEVRRYFEPSEEITKKINQLDFENAIGLQLRFYDGSRPYGLNARGNDALVYGANFYTVEEHMPFIEGAINFLGKNKKYFVSSNNNERAKALFSKYTNFNYLDDYNHIERMFIQSKCEHNIISNSTFGWWGAWLNKNKDKVVFAPEKWSRFNKPTKDLFPVSWKVL